MLSTFKSLSTRLFKRAPLRRVLIISFVLPLIGSVGLVEYLAWRDQQRAVEQLVAQLQERVGDRIQERLRNFTQAPPLATAIMDQALRRGELDTQQLDAWGPYLFGQGKIFNALTYLYFGNQSGDYVQLVQEPDVEDGVSFTSSQRPDITVAFNADNPRSPAGEGQDPPYDPRIRPWYKSADQARWTAIYEFIGSEFTDAPQGLGFSFVRPYFSDDGKTLLGVMGADFTLEEFTRFLKGLAIGKSGEAFVIDRDGTLLSSSVADSPVGPDNQLLKVYEIQHGLLQATGQHLLQQFDDFSEITQPQSLSFRWSGKRQLVQVSPFADEFGLDWLIVVVVPESDFTGAIQANTRWTLLLSLGVLGLAILLAVVIAHRISAAMLKLSRASEDIAQGKLNQNVSESSIEELDTMARSFNHMSQQLQQSYAQLEEYSQALEDKVKERTQALEQEVSDRQQSEQQFRTLVTNIPGAVYRCNLDSNWTMRFISEAIADICGYPASEFIQNELRAFSSIILPEDREYVELSVNQAVQNRVPYILQYRILHADGSIRWVYEKGQGVFAPDGDIGWLDGAIFDITQQKQAEAAIQRRAEVDSMLSQISRTFLDQDIDTAINVALQRLGEFTESDRSCIFQFYNHNQFGMTHEWCNESVQSFLRDRHQIDAEVHPWFYRKLHEGQPFQVSNLADLPEEAAAEKAEFERQSIQSLLNVPMTHAGHVVGFIGLDTVRATKNWSPEDIRVIKRVGAMIALSQARHTAEIALKKAKTVAEVANQAKSDFLANMSHELRSPLNAILGFSQLMIQSRTLSREHQDSISIIHRSGEHLLALINDVLDMSKLESGRTTLNLQDFDLHHLLSEQRSMFQLKAEGKQLQLQSEYTANLPQFIHADQGKLRQVLMNLLSNAIKFTQKGSVTLRAGLHPTQPSTQILNLYVEVEDTGPGMTPEELAIVFEPFVQTQTGQDSQQGTGLGLPISRQFAQLMGGDLVLSSHRPVSDAAGATTAIFTFQAHPVEGHHPEIVQPQRRVIALEPGQPQYRILVADDKFENRQLIVQLLQPLGFEVRGVRNGQEAIAMCRDWSPHLIWMDLRMPVVDGLEATRQIRALDPPPSPTPKIVALTASRFEEEGIAVLGAGCDGFVRKPFQDAELFEIMAEQIGVCYLYEAMEVVSVPAAQDVPIMPSDLSGLHQLSPDLLTQLEDATARIDWDQLFQLIAEIRHSDPTLADQLSNMVQNFEYTQVLQGIQAVQETQ